MIYPLKMSPVFKQYIWGGENLKTLYGKEIPGYPTAESWEVACHKNGVSYVANGELKGQPLTDVIEKLGCDLIGDNIKKDEKFPLLLKILDARDKLSVQVHPEDIYANENENGEKGKTEMWYVMSANKGSQLVYGFKSGVNKEIFESHIKNGTLEEIMNYVDVKAGDVFFIPAGTVHAIGDGIIIAEMQQNSDTTYRVYDYNRVDSEGNKRELHVKKALDVSDTQSATGNEKTEGLTITDGDNKITYLVCCKYFAFEKISIKNSIKQTTNGNRMQILVVAKGNGEIKYGDKSESFKTGDSFVIPAALCEYEVIGECEILKSYVPDTQLDIITPLKNLGYTDIQISKIKGL